MDSRLKPIKNILETLPEVLADPLKQFCCHILSDCLATSHSVNLVKKQKDDPVTPASCKINAMLTCKQVYKELPELKKLVEKFDDLKTAASLSLRDVIFEW